MGSQNGGGRAGLSVEVDAGVRAQHAVGAGRDGPPSMELEATGMASHASMELEAAGISPILAQAVLESPMPAMTPSRSALNDLMEDLGEIMNGHDSSSQGITSAGKTRNLEEEAEPAGNLAEETAAPKPPKRKKLIALSVDVTTPAKKDRGRRTGRYSAIHTARSGAPRTARSNRSSMSKAGTPATLALNRRKKKMRELARLQRAWPDPRKYNPRSLYTFRLENVVRKGAIACIENKWWDRVVLSLIMLNTIQVTLRFIHLHALALSLALSVYFHSGNP